MKDRITKIRAVEVLSGIGRPTVQVDLTVNDSVVGSATVPSGSSKGIYEARELLDGGSRYGGGGVRKVIETVNHVIAPVIVGMSATDQGEIDRALLDLDGTPNKQRLGGNALLGVSLAAAKAGSAALGLPLYRYIGGIQANTIPIPIATVIAGGVHSPAKLDFEDYILIFDGFDRFAEAVEALWDTRRALQQILERKFGSIHEVGGAFAPPIETTEEAFDIMLEAIDRAGHAGKVHLGTDVAASEIFDPSEDRYSIGGKEKSANELCKYYIDLVEHYPLIFIEDAFHQDDFDSHAQLTRNLPDCYIVGDDLFATHVERIQMGVEIGAANTVLLKVNQVGTLTEAIDAATVARMNDYAMTVSLRSSDTDDSFIADLAVALGAQMIKLGSPVRGERVAKYNRLLTIEEDLRAVSSFMHIRS